MRKLILASAIAAITAGSAQAATVYEGKGLTYKVKGDFQVQLRKDLGDNQHLDVEFDDLEIKNSIEYAFGENLTAFGQLDFGFKDAAEGKPSGSKLEEAYLGLDFGSVRVAVGKMDLATDEFGVDAAYENENNEDRFDAQGTDGDDVIRVDAQVGNVDLVASYELEADGEDSASGKYFDLYIGTEIAGIELGAAYQSSSAITNPGDTWGVSAVFDAGVAKIGADYSSSNLKGKDADQLNLVAIVPVAATTKVALGINRIDDDSVADEVNEWYVNATYKVASQKNISVFAEIADTDQNNVNLGYLVGMRLRF